MFNQVIDDLVKKLESFLSENDLKEQIKPFRKYRQSKEKKSKRKKSQKNSDTNEISLLTNNLKGEFKFDIFKYNEKNIALIISYFSIKYLNNLLNHIYEINSTIKNEVIIDDFDKIINFEKNSRNFFIEEVLSYDLLDNRKKILEKMKNILEELKKYNNFKDFKVLSSSLKEISEMLPKTCKQLDFDGIQDLNKIKEEPNTYLKEAIINIPSLDFAEIKTLFIESSDYVRVDGLINIDKIIETQKGIEQFKTQIRPLAQMKFKFAKENEDINELKIVFDKMSPKDEKELQKLGKTLESQFNLSKSKSQNEKKRETNTDLAINQIINKK